ncbi:MAG TPA: hypothetical protein VGR47_04515 [Terracidiphilus sp.]|nr:hypothetical protein [Terracidiphilus sp.]
MDRILQSAGFRNAHTLQHLLEFLVVQAYGPDAETLKESTIGMGVFNRPPDFDPKADPVVRVQVHRLRQKLQEYYETDGRHDSILIDIPKGTYVPVFEEIENPGHRVGAPPLTDSTATGLRDSSVANRPSETQPTEAVSSKNWRRGKLFFSTVLVAATAMVIFAVGFWVGKGQLRKGSNSDPASASTDLTLNPSTDPVKMFWAPLLRNDSTPIIAHADGVFLLDSENDLFWFPHEESGYRGAPVAAELARQFAASPTLVAKAGKLYYDDSYLGSGDLAAVAILSNLFGEMGRKPRIVGGKDLTPEDLQQHNVFLVGSSFQSYAVAQFNTMGDFSFRSSHSSEKDWSGLIENAHPRPGEANLYRTERDPVTRVVKMDHALITIEPGIVPGRYIVDFGGLDTTGSEGAAQFATSKAGVEELSKAFTTHDIHGTNGGPPLFQALLSVRLEKGHEVLGSSLIAVHPLIYSHSDGTVAGSANASTR